MTQTTICLIIFAVTIILYLSNKFPLALTALTSMFLLIVTGCLKPEDALSGFSNTTTILTGSMFVVAAGLSRTQMIHKISNLVYKVSGGSFTKGLLGYCLVTVLVAQVVPSAVLIFTICYPLAADFCRKMNVSPSKAMFSIGLLSIVWVGAAPIGAGATSYIQYNTIMETYGAVGYQMHMFDQFIARLPYSVVLLVYAVFVAPKMAPDKQVGAKEIQGGATAPAKPPLSPVREVIGYLDFLVVFVLILFAGKLGIPTWQICFVGALIIPLTGVLNERETLLAMNMSPLLLFVGSLAMGNALVSTGAGDLVAGLVTDVLGEHPSGYMVGLAFFLLTFLMSQVMSNMAVFSAAQPIVILTCVSYGYNPIGPLLLCFVGAWTAYITPMATIAVPVMMDAGGYDQRDLFKMGWIPALLSIAVAVPWTMFMFPV
ncbi:MAG: SLC13 family permease [Oscillibacter sp.]|nr:SLC13 family permease [Oscillibacter sp.]